MSAPQIPRKRVVFVNRFFHPDQSATAQILSDVAFALAGQSERPVKVVCARLTYEAAGALKPAETVGGVEICRMATTRFGRASLPGRAMDYLSFYVSATWHMARTLRRGDIIVVKTDPPLLSVPLGLVARLKGAVLVNWLQDLYPEVAGELGVSFARGPLGRWLESLRNRSLKKAALNITIGEEMGARLRAHGVSPARILKIPNFCNDEAIRPLPDHAPQLRAEWGFSKEDFIVGYSGNLGRAHDIDTVLRAAEKLRSHPRIKFLFIGGGHLHTRLEAESQARGLTNIHLRPYQPREALAQSLGLPDVHWISLRPELEGLIVPSKLYGIAAAGRPVIMVGRPDGEIGQILNAHGFGETVRPGEAERLAELIEGLTQDPGKLQHMGEAARRYIDTGASRQAALDRFAQVLEKLDRL